MQKKLLYILVCLVTVFYLSCKERFEPNLPSVPKGNLVVEGVINARGSTQIKLSRTTPLDQKKTFKAEPGATVKVEGDDNSSFTLSGSANGVYSSIPMTLNANGKYRLRIKTNDAKEYVSDFVEVKITPRIDSVSWEEKENGVQIFVNTHDPANKTIYYQYDYDETWEIQSAYYALYKLERVATDGTRIIRPTNSSDPQIYNCWKYDTSTNIILGSSAKLANDIIHLNPLVFIPSLDEKLGIRYSIMVRQYALTKEGYQFMEQMKKNTEALGTIFDPQPSALKGNIHAVSDPNETVIGYVNATTVEQKRIFINAGHLVNKGFRIYDNCFSIDIANHPDSLRAYIPPEWPYDAIRQGLSIIAYKIASPRCVDCRERGGINVKPSYW